MYSNVEHGKHIGLDAFAEEKKFKLQTQSCQDTAKQLNAVCSDDITYWTYFKDNYI